MKAARATTPSCDTVSRANAFDGPARQHTRGDSIKRPLGEKKRSIFLFSMVINRRWPAHARAPQLGDLLAGSNRCTENRSSLVIYYVSPAAVQVF